MPALLSRPNASTSKPKAIGTQIARLRNGGNVEIDCIMVIFISMRIS
jgi:hypothetical protein